MDSYAFTVDVEVYKIAMTIKTLIVILILDVYH